MQVNYWARTDSPNVMRRAIGASCSVLGLATALACAEPNRLVGVPLVPIIVPASFEILGVAIFSLAAVENGCQPETCHLGQCVLLLPKFLLALGVEDLIPRSLVL